MRIAIPGARGLIGRRLVRLLLDQGHTPIALTRSAKRTPAAPYQIEIRTWDPDQPDSGESAFQNIDGIVNLSGESVSSGRWSKERMKRIRDSRVLGNQRIVEVLNHIQNRPKILITGSAVGYYGSRGDELLTENSPGGEGFLAGVCRDLEFQADKASDLGMRVVWLRTGVVLSARGGALEKIRRPFSFGLGGRIGNGRQWFPWIHEDDIARIILYSLETESIKGPVNGTAPNPVTNSVFTKVLADLLGRPAILPIPETALKLIFGRMAEVLTASHRAIPKKLENSGYRFQYADLSAGLSDCLVAEGARNLDQAHRT